MNELRLILFDCDGTLVDGLRHHVTAMGETFREHGQTAPEEAALRALVGLNLEVTMRHLAPELSAGDHVELAQTYRLIYRRMRAAGEIDEPLFPAAKETVHALADAGYVLGIATGKGRPGVDHLIDAHGFEGVFSTIQTPNNAPGKPHPGMVEQGMAETGATRENTVVVGDTVFDIEMAQNARVTSIGVSWGFHPVSALQDAGAARLIDHFDELAPTLNGLWA
ncbi:MAG: HAD-IA family hydrolase [Alphaproteobacteria bacterium]